MPIYVQGLCPLLMVFDMRQSLAFYCGKLGFEIIGDSGQGENSGWVWLRLNDADLMLNTAFEEDECPPERITERDEHHSDTILYFGCPDVSEAYRILTEKGLQIDPPIITGYGFKAITFNDPDGYLICFQWKHE